LPGDLAVEVPIVVDAAGVHPVSLGPLPDPIALFSVQVSVQQLAVEAAVHGSKEIGLEALLIDPVVDSTTAAAKTRCGRSIAHTSSAALDLTRLY
jgi:alpha-galactosidase